MKIIIILVGMYSFNVFSNELSISLLGGGEVSFERNSESLLDKQYMNSMLYVGYLGSDITYFYGDTLGLEFGVNINTGETGREKLIMNTSKLGIVFNMSHVKLSAGATYFDINYDDDSDNEFKLYDKGLYASLLIRYNQKIGIIISSDWYNNNLQGNKSYAGLSLLF